MLSTVRKAVFSGSFYDHSSETLSKYIHALLKQCSVVEENKSFGLISPHAGYLFSGTVAAHGFSTLIGQTYKRIVILGPSHRHLFDGASIFEGTGYETPLGVIPIDNDTVSALKYHSNCIQYIPQAHTHEHSIEVELPFIQAIFKNNIPIIPIVIGDQSLDTITDIATALHNVCCDNTLFIASSDFSHFYSEDTAKRMDHRSERLLHDWNLEALFKENRDQKIEMCGISSILIMAMIMKERGYMDVESYCYSHSGDVSKDLERVVGYWSIGYSKMPSVSTST